MFEYGILTTLILSILFFLAGFIDSIAGGGGLISLTSLFVAKIPPISCVGTNKFSMTFGTLFATINYAKEKKVVWSLVFSSIAFALIGSLLGSRLAIMYADTFLRYMLLFVLPILTFLTLRKKDQKRKSMIEYDSGKLSFSISHYSYFISSIASFAIGVYDGFFGPGTGTLYTIMFSFMGLPLIYSAGTTKVLNLTSNIAAFTTFIFNGCIIYSIGIPCAFSSIIGNILGSSYALKKGGKAIKGILILVIVLLYIKIIVEFNL